MSFPKLGDIISFSVTQIREKWDSHALRWPDISMVWRCHGMFIFVFCLELSVRKDTWMKTTSVIVMANITSVPCSRCYKIFKVCLTIFRRFAWNSLRLLHAVQELSSSLHIRCNFLCLIMPWTSWCNMYIPGYFLWTNF